MTNETMKLVASKLVLLVGENEVVNLLLSIISNDERNEITEYVVRKLAGVADLTEKDINTEAVAKYVSEMYSGKHGNVSPDSVEVIKVNPIDRSVHFKYVLVPTKEEDKPYTTTSNVCVDWVDNLLK